jgi:hypothetical protein
MFDTTSSVIFVFVVVVVTHGKRQVESGKMSYLNSQIRALERLKALGVHRHHIQAGGQIGEMIVPF